MRRAVLLAIVASAFCATAALGYPTPVLELKFDNIAEWGEDYTDGGLVKDSSGFGNDGTLQDPPGVPDWLVSGKYGGAFDFTGDGLTSGQAILVLDDDSLDPGDSDFAISLWVLARDNVDGDVLRKGSAATGSTWYKIEHSPSVHNNKFSLNFNTDGTDATVTSDAAYADEIWHFIVAQRVGNTAELWIDGVLDGSATVTGGISNAGNLAIGSKDTLDDDFFNGGIDDVRFWQGSLTADEIQSLYTAVPEPATIALLTLGSVCLIRRRRA